MSITFNDYSIEVKDVIKETAVVFLEEAGGEVEAETKRNCAVVTGQTKGSFTHVVDESDLTVSIGSDYENAIWEEFGTGIYAVNGDGRKTPWIYIDAQGVAHRTVGKPAKRMLFNAFHSCSGKIETIAQSKFGGI